MSKQKERFEKWLEEKQINKKAWRAHNGRAEEPRNFIRVAGRDCIWALLRALLSVVLKNPKQEAKLGRLSDSKSKRKTAL